MSGYRGRLIWPSTVDIRRLDGAATATVNPPNTAPSGVSDIFGEPLTVQDAPGGATTTTRQEQAPVFLPAQIEVPNFGEQGMMPAGADEVRTIVAVFHLADLEDAGFVDGNGRAVINPSDRLAGIYNLDGSIVETFDAVPLFCTKVEPRSFGLSGGTRNLLVCTFSERANG